MRNVLVAALVIGTGWLGCISTARAQTTMPSSLSGAGVRVEESGRVVRYRLVRVEGTEPPPVVTVPPGGDGSGVPDASPPEADGLSVLVSGTCAPVSVFAHALSVPKLDPMTTTYAWDFG